MLETKSNPISGCITLLHFFFFFFLMRVYIIGEKKRQKRERYIGCLVSALQIFRFIFHWRWHACWTFVALGASTL